MAQHTGRIAGLAFAGLVGYKVANPNLGFRKPEEPEPQTRKIVMLFGPPGAGKGTQAPRIQNYLDVPHLSTGDMLRAAIAAKTEVGMRAKAAIVAGELVSDEIVLGIIEDRMAQDDCSGGLILDGFPRTLGQASALDKILARSGESVTRVVNLAIPDEVLEERICGRWIHKKSGRSYHVKFAPPQSLKPNAQPKAGINMLDDVTGEPLMQRSDDNPKALKKRLMEYHVNTRPVLGHYTEKGVVASVDANRNQGDVAFDLGTVTYGAQ